MVHKHRVRIAVSDDGAPVYKWITAHSLDELNGRIVQTGKRVTDLFVQKGMIDPADRGLCDDFSTKKPSKHCCFKGFQRVAQIGFEPMTCRV